MPQQPSFFDEQANEKQREDLQMIFTGKAGGFAAEFAKVIGDVRGIELAPIKFVVAKDLAYWSAEIPGKVVAKAQALTGPMTPTGKSADFQCSRERNWSRNSCDMGEGFGRRGGRYGF